jgi:hypothetical protein
MHSSVVRPAAIVMTAVLAGSVLTGLSAVAAESSTCVATVLKLPAGTPTDVHSHLTASDPTGRYQVGSVQLNAQGDSQALFWNDGAPQVLDPTPSARSFALDVNSEGTVLGTTTDAAGQSEPWLYSNGTYRKLHLPAGMDAISARALNERGDVVGDGLDSATGNSTPVVWPAGSNPRRLPADIGTYTVDINDAGVVIGDFATDKGQTGMVWTSWDEKGTPLVGTGDARVGLTAIRGNYITGVQSFEEDGSVIGGLWTIGNPEVVSYPAILDGVNSAGDVAYFEAGKTIVARQNGTRYEIDALGYNTVEHLFNPRTTAYNAAGDRDYGFGRAVLWSGCAT